MLSTVTGLSHASRAGCIKGLAEAFAVVEDVALEWSQECDVIGIIKDGHGIRAALLLDAEVKYFGVAKCHRSGAEGRLSTRPL